MGADKPFNANELEVEGLNSNMILNEADQKTTWKPKTNMAHRKQEY